MTVLCQYAAFNMLIQVYPFFTPKDESADSDDESKYAFHKYTSFQNYAYSFLLDLVVHGH